MSLRRLSALTFVLALAACATETPAPKIKAPPAPPLVVAPPPPALDWRDLPLSPGGWLYTSETGGSSARFGTGDFILRCLKATGQITLARSGTNAGALTIRTSYGARELSATAGVATLAATDPLLDQIAFSRGRFTVEATGATMLVMPAWAEPARVIEDCRA